MGRQLCMQNTRLMRADDAYTTNAKPNTKRKKEEGCRMVFDVPVNKLQTRASETNNPNAQADTHLTVSRQRPSATGAASKTSTHDIRVGLPWRRRMHRGRTTERPRSNTLSSA